MRISHDITDHPLIHNPLYHTPLLVDYCLDTKDNLPHYPLWQFPSGLESLYHPFYEF